MVVDVQDSAPTLCNFLTSFQLFFILVFCYDTFRVDTRMRWYYREETNLIESINGSMITTFIHYELDKSDFFEVLEIILNHLLQNVTYFYLSVECQLEVSVSVLPSLDQRFLTVSMQTADVKLADPYCF